MPKPVADRLTALRRVPLFAGLSDPELQFLAERAVVRHLQAGELVFAEGDDCEGLYVVESGTVRVFKTSASGREQIIGLERAGNSLAEVPVFDGGLHPASASAMAPTAVLLVRKEDFRSLCLQHPEVTLEVLKALGHRQRHLVNLVNELSFSTVRGRLAAYLLRLAQEEGKKTSRGIEFVLRVNNLEIAASIGTVRDLVSRNLGRLQAEGLIQMQRRTVTIPDRAALWAEVQGQQ